MALSRTYAIVAYVRHNNNADSLYLVFQHFPIEWIISAPDEAPVRMEPAHSPESLISKHMDVRKMIGDINVCIIKSKDWPIDMAERTTTLFIINSLLVGPTKRNIMVTGEFKGVQWKMT